MNWLTPLLLLATIGGVHLQCFTHNDDFMAATYKADLSGVTDFGLELYKQLNPAQSPDNFFFSPYSIWSALTLAYFGSAGNTQRQMEASLRVSDKVSTIKMWRDLERWYENRQKNNTLYTFQLANRAYFHNTLHLRQCIKSILHKEVKVVNFYDTTNSAKDINNFVSETTKGRITQVVTPEDLTDALMVLVNAAFFKGTWKYQFKPSNTRSRDFFINSQDSFPIAMMSQKGSFKYGVSRQLGARILELPYSGDEMSMFVLLPTTDLPAESRFINMIKNLNGATLRDAINPRNMMKKNVDVQLPRFKFTMQIKDELEQALARMGMVDLFDGNLANMTDFEPFEDLSIDKTIHKAFVEVNEEGTEAAAVTALISITRSSIPQAPKIIRFHANQPFIFIIYDNMAKNVLFLGAIKNR